MESPTKAQHLRIDVESERGAIGKQEALQDPGLLLQQAKAEEELTTENLEKEEDLIQIDTEALPASRTDPSFCCKLALGVTLLVLLAAGLSLVVFWLAEHSLSFLLMLVVVNMLFILYFGNVMITHLIFPFGQKLVKFNFHQQMNLKMTKEVQVTLERVEQALVEM